MVDSILYPRLRTPSAYGRVKPSALVQASEAASLRKQALSVDPLMNLREIVPMLGNPSYAALYKWIRAGRLKVWRSGLRGQYRTRLSWVTEFIEKNQVTPDE
jgi:hypothetical protein